MLSGAVGDAAGSVLRLPAEELCNLPQSPPQSPANLPRCCACPPRYCASGFRRPAARAARRGGWGWEGGTARSPTSTQSAGRRNLGQSRRISVHLSAHLSTHLGSLRLTSTHHGSVRLPSAGKASWAAILVRDVPFGGLPAADEGGPAVFFLFYRIFLFLGCKSRRTQRQSSGCKRPPFACTSSAATSALGASERTPPDVLVFHPLHFLF